ncbi:MAG: hypothetical protein E7041_01485 [Lentisphaerae bacterium]|nr:hypothetical protein [Lentisphaerota bacterium]
MAKENKILAVDIGGSSLKMAEFAFPGDSIQMTKCLFRKIEKLEGESDSECFERNYLEMLAEGGFTAASVRLLLSASNSFQRLSKLPPVLGSSAAVSRLIEFEASQAVPYSMAEVEWGYQLLQHRWQETVRETEEDGSVVESTVNNEEYEALFVAMKSDDVISYTDVIERSGKTLISVELASLALFNAAVVSQIREDESVLLLDIGARCTSLMIADQRRIFIRNIPIGGDTINTQIIREFGVGEAEAEDFKRRYGFVALGGAYDEPDSELAATISKLARNTMTRLHGEISRSISVWRAQHGGNAPVRVLLAGGGSTMQYTTDFFQEKLRLPVEYLNTFGLVSISPEVDVAQLQSVASMVQPLIGTALHEIGTLPVDISLLPRVIRNQVDFTARKPYLFASAAALVCCMIISLVGVNRVASAEQERSKRVIDNIATAKREVASVQRVNSEMMSAKGKYDTACRFYSERNKFTNLLNELQQFMPDQMWLVSLMPKFQERSYDENENRDRSEGGNDVDRTAAKVNELRDVDEFVLTGYVLNIDGFDAIGHFKENIRKKSQYFSDKVYGEPKLSGQSNLSYFEITLSLKEKIKK